MWSEKGKESNQQFPEGGARMTWTWKTCNCQICLWFIRKPSALYSCLPLFDPHCTWLFCPPYSESVTVTHQDSSNIYQTCCSEALNLLILKACPAACWINDGVKLIQVFQAWNKGSSKEIWHAWHILTDIYIDCVWEAICSQLQMVWRFKRPKG